MKNNVIIALILLLVWGCRQNNNHSDAYGNFEAVETLVSSEMSGKILFLNIDEGNVLEKNQKVGLIDTLMPSLQLEEIKAQVTKVQANLANMDAQIDILEQQKENLTLDKIRIENMIKTEAATQKQYDDVIGALKVIDKQRQAQLFQKSAIAKELLVIEAKKLLLDEQINKCHILNPSAGTVVEQFAEVGEITAMGKPLYKIAKLDTVILRAYVSGGQLFQTIKGKTCRVYIDKGTKDFIELEGTITWISSQAEFTPKIIQTKEERVNMVYAVKIEVPNDGSIKIGMPGEVKF